MKSSNNRSLIWLLSLAILMVNACAEKQTEAMKTDNVLLQEWTGPFGGVPAFDQMKLEDVIPALERGMELNLQEVDEIANNTEPATFENTIVAMESAGKVLDRIYRYYDLGRS